MDNFGFSTGSSVPSAAIILLAALGLILLVWIVAGVVRGRRDDHD